MARLFYRVRRVDALHPRLDVQKRRSVQAIDGVNGEDAFILIDVQELNSGHGNGVRPRRRAQREGAGGIFMRASGQVATGTFVADASGRQTFTNFQQQADPNATPPLRETRNACSAIQIRDLTPKTLAPRATYYGEGTPGTNTQPKLGGTRCSPGIALSGHPKIGASLQLTAARIRYAHASARAAAGRGPSSRVVGRVIENASASRNGRSRRVVPCLAH